MEWYVHCLRNYANFEGRARRKEYWMFILVNFLIGFVLYFISDFLQNIYGLAMLIPAFAVGVRRLHDLGKSGSYILLGLIPIFGWIILLVYNTTEGEMGPNIYGPDPKGDASDRGYTY